MNFLSKIHVFYKKKCKQSYNLTEKCTVLFGEVTLLAQNCNANNNNNSKNLTSVEWRMYAVDQFKICGVCNMGTMLLYKVSRDDFIHTSNEGCSSSAAAPPKRFFGLTE